MGNNAATALVDSHFLRIRGYGNRTRVEPGAEIGHLPNEIEDFARPARRFLRVIIVDVYR